MSGDQTPDFAPAGLAYETMAHPLDPAERRSLWVTTDVGTFHTSCGTQEQCERMGQRYVDAGIAPRYALTECCQSTDVACAFDAFSDAEDIDKVIVLALALARAEGRDIGQPYRCARHGGALSFGGCCGR